MKVAIIGQYPQNKDQVFTGPMRVVYSLIHQLKEKNVSVEIPTRIKKPFPILKALFSSSANIFNIHGVGLNSAIALLIGKLLSKKVVYTAHGLAKKERVLGYPYPLIYLFYEYLLFTLSDKITAVSTYLKEMILKAYPVPEGKIIPIPNGIPANFYQKTSAKTFLDKYHKSKAKVIFISVGGTKRVKGYDFIIKSLKKIEKLDWVFYQIGPEKEEDRNLKNLVEKMGLNKKIFFLGPLQQEILKSAYTACDFFILTSLYDPYGLTPVEAMAYGKPSLISDQMGMKDLVTDGKDGFIVKFGDKKQAASRLKELILNQSLRTKMGKAAKITAQKAAKVKPADQYLKVFSLLAE